MKNYDRYQLVCRSMDRVSGSLSEFTLNFRDIVYPSWARSVSYQVSQLNSDENITLETVSSNAMGSSKTDIFGVIAGRCSMLCTHQTLQGI